MHKRSEKLITPTDFQFPYKPYDIQQTFMQRMYAVLENGKIGIFESPTGTGKSLTLICAALRWLKDDEEAQRRHLAESIAAAEAEIRRLEHESDAADDWIKMHYETNQQRIKLRKLNEMLELLQLYEQRLQQMRKSQLENKGRKRKLPMVQKCANLPNEDALEDNDLNSSSGSGSDSDNVPPAATETRHQQIQIYFCSRTHSQLSQVLREIKRTEYAAKTRCLTLASRKHLCVHPEVKLLPNAALNERCLSMARKPKKQSKSCMAKCAYKNQTAVQQLTEAAVVNVLDIEEVVQAGTFQKACPYYATREAVPFSEIVFLPYQMLLHKRTREQSGVVLQDSIIIIDEAHNLLDTIGQIYSHKISLQELLIVEQQINGYKVRYASRFNYKNLLQVNQLLFVVRRLIKTLQPQQEAAKATRILRTYELTAGAHFDNIDIFKLLEFAQRMRFAQKLQAFAQHNGIDNSTQQKENHPAKLSHTKQLLLKIQKQQQEPHKRKTAEAADDAAAMHALTTRAESVQQSGAICQLLSFLEVLIDNAEDGRILMLQNGTNSSYKYILLNPGSRFHEIVQHARAIIIAGGTMQPTDELTTQLFADCAERVELHFFEHVVKTDAVLPFVLTRGASARPLCFNYAQRSSLEMLSDLSLILLEICKVVPAGLICFVPSYDYLQQIYIYLESNSQLMTRMTQNKRIFCERSNSSAEQLLADYATHIKSGAGALLFSVVGGKLSEGLNFADDLARGVIMVGLPYPNSKCPEMQERMRYLSDKLHPAAGNDYYENVCLKAVNQCIGRAVRHINDYACIYLLDSRYANERIQSKLAKWVVRHLECALNMDSVLLRTRDFFNKRK